MLYQRGKSYSQDLRERVFAASDDGERVGEVADLLRVSVSYVSKASVGLIWHTLKLLGLTLKKSRSGRPSRIGRTSLRRVRHGVRASRRLIRPG